MQKQPAEAFCISRSLALCLVYGPGPSSHSWPPICIYRPWPANFIYQCWPQLYLPALAPNLCLLALAPNLYLPTLAPNLHLPALALNLYLPALAYNFMTSPRPKFVYTSIVYQCCISIYGSGLGFVLPVWICIYLIIGSSSSGSSNNSSSNFVGINNTNICMSVLLNYGKQTEACTHTGS